MEHKGTVEIDTKRCKGCGICIEFCPKKVLAAQPPLNKAYVKNAEACVQCGMCELYCPDWAIRIVIKE